MSPDQSDVQTRLSELEATVRGLTQELVEANERIRQLESTVEGEPAVGADGRPEKGLERAGRQDRNAEAMNDGGEDEDATKQMGGDDQPDDEADSELDDIIVA